MAFLAHFSNYLPEGRISGGRLDLSQRPFLSSDFYKSHISGDTFQAVMESAATKMETRIGHAMDKPRESAYPIHSEQPDKVSTPQLTMEKLRTAQENLEAAGETKKAGTDTKQEKKQSETENSSSTKPLTTDKENDRTINNHTEKKNPSGENKEASSETPEDKKELRIKNQGKKLPAESLIPTGVDSNITKPSPEKLVAISASIPSQGKKTHNAKAGIPDSPKNAILTSHENAFPFSPVKPKEVPDIRNQKRAALHYEMDWSPENRRAAVKAEDILNNAKTSGKKAGIAEKNVSRETKIPIVENRNPGQKNNSSIHIKGEAIDLKPANGENKSFSGSHQQGGNKSGVPDSPQDFSSFMLRNNPKADISAGFMDRLGQMVNSEEMRAQIQERVAGLLNRSKIAIKNSKNASLDAQLYPKELGKITLKLALVDGNLQGKFLVDNVAIQREITDRLAKVVEDLRQSGHEVGSFEVNVRSSNQGFSDNSGEEMKDRLLTHKISSSVYHDNQTLGNKNDTLMTGGIYA